MRGTYVLMLAFFAAWAAPSLSQEPATVTELMRRLKLTDHANRTDAAKAVVRMQSLPESALNPVVSYLGLEAIEALRWKEGPRGKIEVLPVVGDEVSLDRFKAAPMRYINRPFVVAGWLERSSNDNFQFHAARDAYKSFSVKLAGLDGRSGGGLLNVHIPRYIGSLLTDHLEDAVNRQDGIKIRFRCMIQSANIDRHFKFFVEIGQPRSVTQTDIATFGRELIEATDWQVLAPDGKSWMPWTLEHIYVGFRLLSKVGKPPHPRAIDLVTEDVLLPDLRAERATSGDGDSPRSRIACQGPFLCSADGGRLGCDERNRRTSRRGRGAPTSASSMTSLDRNSKNQP